MYNELIALAKSINPEDYKDKMKVFLHRVYMFIPLVEIPTRKKSKARKWRGEEAVVPMDCFQDQEAAVEAIKTWLDAGAITFAHFNSDYTKLIIQRDANSEKFIQAKIKAKKEQVRSAEVGV